MQTFHRIPLIPDVDSLRFLQITVVLAVLFVGALLAIDLRILRDKLLDSVAGLRAKIAGKRKPPSRPAVN